ncbi:hypothetical protein [Paraburkholderia caledonica]|uniref:FMN phosphatase YigB (HAD superfamily) n=1 Tax=Paraburkholderia caledonica TaxID=134536 RepID=A0AB73INI1_9BURK|nr:FMN phosphatase YigB (HAD superfamily) [Paraburkholderia caledonica]
MRRSTAAPESSKIKNVALKSRPHMRIKAVFFDVGETLVDESRDWGEWADHPGISRLSLDSSLGAVIEKGQHHRRVFEIVRPGVNFTELRRERELTGSVYSIGAQDLYPDVLPCLR